jgi:hypothetical protein
VAILRGIDSGETAQPVRSEVNVREATLYRWKQHYGALEFDAQSVVAAGMCSRRQACRYLGLARSW